MSSAVYDHFVEQARFCRPDVVLLDLSLPDFPSIDIPSPEDEDRRRN